MPDQGQARDQMRVADAERERVAAVLEQAHSDGRLTLAEYDERVRAAHGAVVHADLTPLTVDLPPEPAPTPAAEAPRGRSPLRFAVALWATVSVVNLVIWVAVSVGAGDPVAPWWIWVAGPWGAVLALQALAMRAGLPAPPMPFGCVSARR